MAMTNAKSDLWGGSEECRGEQSITPISVDGRNRFRNFVLMDQGSEPAQRAALLEREHFVASRADAARVTVLYRSMVGSPIELGKRASEIARIGPGKYDRAHWLMALLRRAAVEADGIARAGTNLESPPEDIASQLKEIKRLSGDIDAAVEYAITGDCSVLQRERRVFGLVYSHMRRQYEITRKRLAEALPPQLPSPLSVASANPYVGRAEIKRRRGEAGQLTNAIKGETTRQAVVARAVERISDHGPLTSGDRAAIVRAVGKSDRHVRRILAENAIEIERRVTDIQKAGHSIKSDMSF